MTSLRDADHAAVRSWLAAAERGDLAQSPPGAGLAPLGPDPADAAVTVKFGASGGMAGYGFGGALSADAFGYRPGPTPWKLVETYKSLVYICTELNAGAVARIPLRLYARTGRNQRRPRAYCCPRPVKGARLDRLCNLPYLKLAGASDNPEHVDEITEHPLLDLLSDPSESFDGNLLIYYIAVCMDVVGAAYLRPDDYRMRVPGALWALPPQYVTVVPDGGNYAKIGRYYFGGESYGPDEIIRIRFPDLRNPYLNSYSPARAAFQYAGLEDDWVSTQRQLLENGPRPASIASLKDPKDGGMGPDQRRRLEIDLNRRHAGGASGRVIVADAALDFHPLTYPPADLAGLQISDYDMERTANCFGVPLSYLKTETNLANLQAAERQHATRAVEKRCVLIAGALTKYLARPVDDRLFFAFDSASQEEREQRTRVFDLEAKAGKVTINEWRAEDGQPPVPWGDEPWLANSLTQPSAAKEAAEAPAAGGGPGGPGGVIPDAAAEAEEEGAPGPPGEGSANGEPGGDADEAAEKALIVESLALLRAIKGRLAPTDAEASNPAGIATWTADATP